MTVPTPPLLGEWQPLPATDPGTDAARAEADALLAEANRMHRQADEYAQQTRQRAEEEAHHHVETAKGLRASRLAAADEEARRIRQQAQAETDAKQQRDDRINAWSLRGALAATIGLTASGEFSLARLAGWPGELAWLLPVAIDIYVVQTFRRHRDVPLALLLMIAANAFYHLAAATGVGLKTSGRETVPEWWLVVGVAAIAPVVMWRIHRITAPPPERGERAQVPDQPQVSAEPERPSERPEPDVSALTERPSERPIERPIERPAKPKGERRERAHRAPKKSDSERRRERVRALYDELGRRPEWTEIRDALVAARLADKNISRPTVQRLRDAVEKREPALAALGSTNIRTLKTGS